MTASSPTDAPCRFLIGIDLGTTNSAVAFVDTAEDDWHVRDFAVPQIVAPGEIEARDVLPSFHYESGAQEFASGSLRLPWGEETRWIVGLFAREQGAGTPGRLVSSAKSWLSHSGVNRTAPLLPWHAAADVEKLSPVEVSSRYLAHIRGAWDAGHPDHPLAGQQVVLTVPASFDEVARELTVQAAQRAGIVRLVLVEEPQSAFYAWIHAQGAQWDKRVRAGQTILVCDIGGGTSDFTLIRVRPSGGGKVLFHRIAVGEHLILGGDNLDLALAHHIETRLSEGQQLDPRQWAPLVRVCRKLKETLLGPDPPEKITASVPGIGAKLVGGARQIEVSRDEVRAVLVDGFLPRVPLGERPRARRSGFQEFGLPYAPDPGISRHLASFLSAHRDPDASDPAARPDLVLCNGGLFESPVLRQRLIEILTSWFNAPGATKEWQPQILHNERLDLAVARGAAYYGMVRRGRGVRISGGLAHSYYLGVEAAGSDSGAPSSAICLLPAGVEEGQTVDLPNRTFELLIRQPVEFPLYYSSTRTTDAPGQLVPVDAQQLSPLPPIRTVLQSGPNAGAASVPVRLHARLTEIGTLDIWCAESDRSPGLEPVTQSQRLKALAAEDALPARQEKGEALPLRTRTGGGRRWRLQFDVRAATRAEAAPHTAEAEAEGLVEEQGLASCREIIARSFTRGGDDPAGIIKRLERIVGLSRNDWPSSLLRGLWETLMEVEAGRKISVEHEARWLGLTGFCLRPGYGLAVDDWRVGQTWRLFAGGVVFIKNELCRAEWWILWRRIGGGLVSGQQALIAEPLAADWRNLLRKGGAPVRGRSPSFQFGPHESAEVWRLLGSMELIRPTLKTELGEMLLTRLPREKSAALRDAGLFALGRLGARVPVYGPLNVLVPPETAEAWSRRLMEIDLRNERTAFALVQLCRRTGDRFRDISDDTRAASLAWLAGHNAAPHLQQLVEEGGHLREEEQRTVFGESLPRGLRIE